MTESRDAFGLWNMGDGRFHPLLSSVEAKRLVKSAWRQGITLFDSAYSYGNADALFASAMKELGIPRENYTLITKVMPVPTLEKKTETSLRRLGTDYVDALLLHWPSDEKSVYESLRTLEKLQKEGRTKEIGVSNFPLPLLQKTVGEFPITIHERPLSLVWNKDYKEEKALGLKTIAYAPGAFGCFGRTTLPEDSRKDLYFWNQPVFRELDEMVKTLAEKYHTTPYWIAFSWVSTLSPYAILRGASTPDQIQKRVLRLEDEETSRLTALASALSTTSSSDNIFGHNYLLA